jgi:decaprenylphospho-beta-D-ribofuranose 2-oxidase
MKKVKIASWSYTLPTTTYLAPYEEQQSQLWRQTEMPFIPRGNGRSYGDAAYVTDGLTLSSQKLDGIGTLDVANGLIECGAGVTIGALHRYLEAQGQGWAFPIYGGTQWGTIGGAAAVDIHGKNDVAQGSFGNHVAAFKLVASDGQTLDCSKASQPDLFAATIGGMGLTGLIKTVTLKLQRGLARALHVRSHMLPIGAQVLDAFEITACDFQFFSCAGCTFATCPGLYAYATYSDEVIHSIRKPIDLPTPTINLCRPSLVPLVNQLQRRLVGHRDEVVHIRDFNYIGPHEYFKQFNKLCGSLIEYQFVVAAEQIETALTELFKIYQQSSFLCYGYVLKKLGTMPRAGLLSFPKAGYTVSFLVQNHPAARKFLIDFTDLIIELGGRIYLTKDSCILARQFERMYDQLDQWRTIVRRTDPTNRVQSDLSIRLGMKPW